MNHSLTQAQRDFPVLYWNHVALEMNRVTHTLGGPQTGPTMSSRALGLLHLAMHDAYFYAVGSARAYTPYLPITELNKLWDDAKNFPSAGPSLAGGDKAALDALCGAAAAVLQAMYGQGGPGISANANSTLRTELNAYIGGFQSDAFNRLNVLDPAHRFGAAVAELILDSLAVGPDDIGADAGNYVPRVGPFYFRDEPVNPVRRVSIDPDHPERGTFANRVYHGPFYGATVPAFAVQAPDQHVIAPPPKKLADLTNPASDYAQEVNFVREFGGAPQLASTKRTPDQTVAGYYWAYDGANLIGTPPRLYNQVLTTVALQNLRAGTPKEQHEELIRVFALANVAMADAGKFAWKEKYRYNYWRPLTAVRENDPGCGPSFQGQPAQSSLAKGADPFWLALGAPETNTNKLSFKPPFPAYPSGHATFGAACFQMARLFYTLRNTPKDATPEQVASRKDGIAFSFVSDELDGINRDLHGTYDPAVPIVDQPGIVRTRVVRHFDSLWQAMFENAISRIYLGVHFRFDGFDVADLSSPTSHEAPTKYSNVYFPGGAPVPPASAIGGVPLGMGIANDIFQSHLTISADASNRLNMVVAARATAAAPSAAAAVAAVARSGGVAGPGAAPVLSAAVTSTMGQTTRRYKSSNTNIR